MQVCSWPNNWTDKSSNRENIFNKVSDLSNDFGNHEDEYIYLNPMYASLDCSTKKLRLTATMTIRSTVAQISTIHHQLDTKITHTQWSTLLSMSF